MKREMSRLSIYYILCVILGILCHAGPLNRMFSRIYNQKECYNDFPFLFIEFILMFWRTFD